MTPRGTRLPIMVLMVAWLSACMPTTPFSTPQVDPTPPPPAPGQAPAALQPGAAIRFQKLSIEEGLSQSVVIAMAQDKTGFLWLGTADGLNRYDGYHFTVYNANPSDPSSLSDGWVTALLADTDGSLWVGTGQGGLNRYDPRTGKFIRYQNTPDDKTSLTAGTISSLYHDRESNLWVGTGEGLNRFDPSTNTFTRFLNDERDPSSISHSSVTTIFQDSSGRLWFGTNKGLDLYHPADQTFSHYVSVPDDSDTLSDNAIVSMVEDQQGNLWVGTKRGLNRFDAPTGRSVRYLNDSSNPDSLGSDNVNALWADSDGILWIATNGGLDRYDPRTDKFSHYRSNPLVPNSLSMDVVYSIFEDREGVLWFGTWGGGVDKYDRAQNQFAFYRSDPGNPGSLKSGGVFPIFADADGTAWAGVFGSGLERFDPATGVFTHYNHDPKNKDSLGGPNVWSILRDRQGVLWLGTDNGLDQFDEQNKRFIHHVLDESAADDSKTNCVEVLYEDSAGNLWVATEEGLYRYDRTSGQFISYTEKADKEHKTPIGITHIGEDHFGNLWISTGGMGLYYFDVKANTFKRFTHDPEDTNGIADNRILWTYEDPRNIVWMATAGSGVNKYDPATGTFTSYTDQQGLANNFVYCIVPDDEGSLWMTTNRGISKFNPLEGSFQNYTVDDGLQSNEFNSFACAHAADGSIYVGGLVGINRFFPKEIHTSTYQPPIVLTSFTRESKPLPTSPMPEAIREVTLKWPQNSFEFEFASLSFSRPNESQYAYMLDAFDTDWNVLGAKRDGRYTNLPGGDYVLRLKASNRDGAWAESSAPIHVTVIPPFWQTWWFIVMSGLVVAAGVFGVYRLRVQSVEAQKVELERQVKERTLEIERLFEQTKELAIIEERNRLARELHDSAKQKAFAALAQLGTASGLIQQNASAARTHISEAENLVYDVIQELTFLIQEMYPLALQEKGLAAVLREYVFEWENRTDISADIHVENERRLPLEVEQALYRITQEAMANIARHSHASHADLRVLYEAERVTLTVSDNGQGFDQSQKPKGIGLRSIQERAESVGGEALMESIPGQGTRIEIRVSLKQA